MIASIPLSGGIHIPEIIISLAALYIIVRRKKIKKYTHLDYSVVFCGVLLASGVWVSSIISGDPLIGLYQGMRYAIVYTILYPVIRFIVDHNSDEFHAGLYFSAVILSLLAVFVFLSNNEYFPDAWKSAGRVSLWFGVNSLGGVLALAFSSLLVNPPTRYGFGMLGRLIGMLILVLGVLTTISFGSFAILLISLAFYIALNINIRSFILTACIGLLVISCLYWFWGSDLLVYLENNYPRLNSRLFALFDSNSFDMNALGSFSTRVNYNKESIDYISNNLIFGLGAGSRDEISVYSHTYPILIWLESGVLGLFAYILLAFSSLSASISLMSKHIWHVGVAGAVLIAAWLTWSFGSAHMYQTYYYCFLFPAIANMSLSQIRRNQ